jgi:hypothetical protein
VCVCVFLSREGLNSSVKCGLLEERREKRDSCVVFARELHAHRQMRKNCSLVFWVPNYFLFFGFSLERNEVN